MVEKTPAQRHGEKLTLRRAIQLATINIVHRPGRSAITGVGVMLGVAFLTYVVLWGAVNRAVLGESVLTPTYVIQQRWLVSLSLLTCAVGVTNTMLMSVVERYREIGTMKCLGAPDWFIFRLFVCEAAFLGIAGSAGGWLLALLSVVLMALVNHGLAGLAALPLVSSLSTLGLALVVGTFLSIGSAFYPARYASGMPPAAAMRAEF